MKEIKTIVKQFDENNNMIYYKTDDREEIKKFKDNKIQSKIFTTENFKETKTYEYEGNKVIITTVTEYDIDKEKEKQMMSDKYCKDIYKKVLSENGKEIKEVRHYKDGKLVCSVSDDECTCYEYDENGNVTYHKYVNKGENKIVLEEFYKYDDHNNPINFKLYIDKKLINNSITNYKYFDNGNYEITENVKDPESGCEYLYKEILDSKDRTLYFKNNKKEYWMEYEGNTIKYKDIDGLEYTKELNERGDIIYYKDNKGKEIEYKYIY